MADENTLKKIARQIPRPKSAWPIRRIAGRDFHVVPGSYFKQMFADLPTAHEFKDDEEHLLPVVSADDGLEFPARPELEDAGLFVRSGIASHGVDPARRWLPHSFSIDAPLPGFSATDLSIALPDDFDWYAACMKVLEAHGWERNGEPTEVPMRIVQKAEPEWFGDVEARAGDNWRLELYEKAAKYGAPPLCRLWYAANMLALYYVHREDMLVGYLWCEYGMRLRYEQPALKHLGVLEKNRENGQKGGQSDRKVTRHRVLNEIAISRLKDIAFLGDGEIIKSAKRWAAEHDKGADDPLYLERGKPLSPGWYSEWLAQFRPIARKMMQAIQ